MIFLPQAGLTIKVKSLDYYLAISQLSECMLNHAFVPEYTEITLRMFTEGSFYALRCVFCR
jgi:hypothetical protein